MVDFTASARRLYRRMVERTGESQAGAAPGTPSEGDGAGAVAAVEAWVSDGAGLGASFPAAAAVRRFRLEARSGLNLDHRLPAALDGAGPRGGLAAAIGLATAGQRAAAFLSGPDLLAAQDLLAVAARRLLPLVVHLASRAGSGPGEALGSDHLAYHAAAAGGALQLFAADVQEAVDLTLIARRVAEEALAPALVAMDGPETALSVQDFLLPEPETVRRFLGRPGEAVHPPTAGQEMLFGKHRRRVPRWHDPERPVLSGAAQGPEAFALAAAARRLTFDPHLPELLAQACDAFGAATGRRYGPLRTHRVEGASVLLVAQGSAVETAEAAADRARAAGLKVGVVGMRVLRPFPAAELAELLRGRRQVAVLERLDAALGAEPPLLAEIRSLLARARGSRGAAGEADSGLPVLGDREIPPLTSVHYGLGGFPLRGGDLMALCRRLAAKDFAGAAGPIYLGLDTAPTGAAYPKREALRDALGGAYPRLSDLGLRSAEAMEMRPDGAFTVAVVHSPGDRSGRLSQDLAVLLRRLAGGHLRARRDPGWERWGAARCDLVTWSPAPLRDPGDDVAAEMAVGLDGAGAPELLRRVRDGGALLLAAGSTPDELRHAIGGRELRLYAAGGPGTPSERLLGAIAGVLAAEGRLEIKLRKLLAARRGMLEEEGADEVEWLLDELQAGFEGVSSIATGNLPEAPTAPLRDGATPAAARRLDQGGPPVSNLPDFWGRVGMLYRDGEPAALLPDPFLAAGSVPPLSAALRAPGLRALLPAFDPAACTGCGDCWSACPHAALGPAVLGAAALLDHGMSLAKGRGRATDKLRMVTSKLAAEVGREMSAQRWAGDLAGPLLDAAFVPMIDKMKLPDERKDAIRDAYAAVRGEIAALPVARTAPFFDRPEAAGDGGELFTLAVDPDACKGCGLCVAVCEPGALAAVADDRRRSAAAGNLWRLVEELPEAGEATLERARLDPEVGPLAGALLSPAARRVMARGDGAEAGSGEVLALRQVLGAAAFHLEPRREELLAEIGEAREKLAQSIRDGLSRALPDRDLDALARGLDALHQPDTDLADLTSRVEAAFETDRVDVSRTRRLVAAARALADLEGRLGGGGRPRSGFPGRAPFGLVVAAGERAPAWAGTFPHNPFAVPVTVAGAGDAGDLARGILEGQLRQTLEAVRALRRARLELEHPNGPRPADLEALDRLGWRDLEPGERRLCPPVFLVASEDALAAHAAGLAGLLGALAGDLPLKLLVLADPGASRDAEAPFDLGLLASAERRALFLQTSIAAGDHLEGGVAAAVAHDGPAFLRVHAPSAEGHAADATLARAREAADALPLLLSPPGATGRPELGRLAAIGPDEPDRSDQPDGSPTADAPDAAAIAALEARHAAELTALRGEHEVRIAGLRASFQQETAQRIRSRLLQLATAQRPASEAPAQDPRQEPPA